TGVHKSAERRAVDFQAFGARGPGGGGRAVNADVFVFARRSDGEAAVAHSDFKDARSRRHLLAQRLEPAPAGALARRPRVRSFVGRVVRRRVRPNFSANWMRIFSHSEVIEVSTLTPAAGPHHVARNLSPTPHFGRETNRTSPRRAIAVVAIGH